MLPMAEVTTRGECSCPQQSTEISLVPYLIQEKRGISSRAPNHLYLAEQRKERGVLLAITKEFEVLSKLGSKAQKMKKKEHIPLLQAEGNSVCSCRVTKDHEASEMPNPTSAPHPVGSLVSSQRLFWLCQIHTCRGKNSAEALEESAPCFSLPWQKRIQRFLTLRDKLCHLLSLIGSAGS